jgi:hypothetical protein
MMKIDGIIALSSSIAALATAVAAFLNIKEMQRQRATTYHPELIITEKTFISQSGYVAPEWQKYHEGKIIKEDSTSGISLCNIGLGAAKNIKASWSFPTEELITLIKNEAKKNGRDISFIDTDPMFWTVKLDGALSSITKEQFLFKKIDYIIPSSNQSDPIILRLPTSYISLTSLLTHVAQHTAIAKFQIPDLKLKLEYYDIANSKHSSSFTLEFEYWGITRDKFMCVEFIASLKPKIDVL